MFSDLADKEANGIKRENKGLRGSIKKINIDRKRIEETRKLGEERSRVVGKKCE